MEYVTLQFFPNSQKISEKKNASFAVGGEERREGKVKRKTDR